MTGKVERRGWQGHDAASIETMVEDGFAKGVLKS